MFKFSHLPIGILALTIAAPVFAQSVAPTATPATPVKPAVTAVAPKAETVDINTASAAALKSLPGMTEADAAKVMQARPYRDINELVSKKIVAEAQFAKIKDRITAGHPKS
jgi:DNA uptake protein ComE-like DNA-binding protein